MQAHDQPTPFGKSAVATTLKSGPGDAHPTTLATNPRLRLATLEQDGSRIILTAQEARHAATLLAAFAREVGQ
jgi:hypothetical protein